MTPDDKRHGTNAGYVALCRCEGCTLARRRYQKAHRLAILSGENFHYTATEIRELITPWLRMGLTKSAIEQAAGVRTRSDVLDKNRIRAATYNAFAAVTEDDFNDKALALADLTRTRIFSLMAAGHQLLDMPINPHGLWRTRTRISVGSARAIRDHYQAKEFKVGTSLITASRAKKAGHVVPMAWDDPGTLAWPHGTPSTIAETPICDEPKNAIDFVVVERILNGEAGLRTTLAEKREVVRRWTGSHGELARLTGWKVERYTDRIVGYSSESVDLLREDGAA